MNQPTELPDTGARSEFETGAVRDASIGKGTPSDIPPDFIRSVAKRFEDGAIKYSGAVAVSSIDILDRVARMCSCENTTKRPSATRTANTPLGGFVSLATPPNTQKQNGLHATPSELQNQEDCAPPVTTGNSKTAPPSSPNGSARTPETGSREIRSAMPSTGINGRRLAPGGLNRLTETDNFLGSGLPLKTSTESSNYKEGLAASAEVHQDAPDLTSTTATKPGSYGGSCAAGATKVSDSWATISKLLSEHSTTCDIHRRIRFYEAGGVVMMKDQKPNWQKGIPLSRYIDSIMRHTLQLSEGDPTEDHVGAVGWNAAAYQWTLREIKAGRLPATLDDRQHLLPNADDESRRVGEDVVRDVLAQSRWR